MKIHISARIDENVVGGVERSAQKRAISKSEIIERALSQFLAKDVELTSTERKFYQKTCIEFALDRLSSTQNAHFNGDLRTKIESSIAFCAGFSTLFPLRDSSKLAELSLFEILRDVKEYDKTLFEEIIPILKKFRKLYVKFTQLHFTDEGSVTL